MTLRSELATSEQNYDQGDQIMMKPETATLQ